MAKYMSEGGNKGGSPKRVKGPGQPMKKGGYPSPFDGRNEMGDDQLKMAKKSMQRGSSKGQHSAKGYGMYKGSGSKNEMD